MIIFKSDKEKNMIYKNETRQFGELAEYIGIYPEKDVREMLECNGLLFTKRKLELAKRRWFKKDKPNLIHKLFGIFG